MPFASDAASSRHPASSSGRTARAASSPHYFSAADGSILAFAGLWDQWKDPATGEAVLSCTVIVSGASDWMAPYHDRMPVLIGEGDVEAWLRGEAGAEVLRPAAEALLQEWPVSQRVNRAGAADDPGLIEPVVRGRRLPIGPAVSEAVRVGGNSTSPARL